MHWKSLRSWPQVFTVIFSWWERQGWAEGCHYLSPLNRFILQTKFNLVFCSVFCQRGQLHGFLDTLSSDAEEIVPLHFRWYHVPGQGSHLQTFDSESSRPRTSFGSVRILASPPRHHLGRNQLSNLPRPSVRGVRGRIFWDVPAVFFATSGRCIKVALEEGQSLGAEDWTMEVLRFSCLVPFHHQPPLSWKPVEFPSYGSGSMKAYTLQAEVEKILEKGVLEIVNHLGPGYYDCLFLVQKVTGWRAIVDISALSRYVTFIPFKRFSLEKNSLQFILWQDTFWYRRTFSLISSAVWTRCFLASGLFFLGCVRTYARNLIVLSLISLLQEQMQSCPCKNLQFLISWHGRNMLFNTVGTDWISVPFLRLLF